MYHIKDTSPWLEEQDGDVMLSYWLSSAGPLPQEFLNFMDDLLNQSRTEECVFEIATPLSSVVDGFIESRRYIAHPDKVVFSTNDRQMVSATREALKSAIEKLDAIQFTDE